MTIDMLRQAPRFAIGTSTTSRHSNGLGASKRDLLHPFLLGQSTSEITVRVAAQEFIVDHMAQGETHEVLRIPTDDLKTGGRLLVEKALARLGRTVDAILVLPSEAALRRTVLLPAAAAHNLRAILQHDLDRHCPVDPEEVYFDYWITGRSKPESRIDVLLRIIKREVISSAVSLCRMAGIEPISVVIEGDEFPLNRATLPLNRKAVLRHLWRWWSAPVLFGLAIVLAVATLTAAFARTELIRNEIAAELSEARSKAEKIERVRAEIGSAQKQSAFLAQQKSAPLAVRVLTEVTRLLPEGSWIYAFQLNGSEIRIRGYSPAASSLIAAFDESPLFANAQFRAPLTQAETPGLERFDLSFDARSKAS